jgi:hypothetical protein
MLAVRAGWQGVVFWLAYVYGNGTMDEPDRKNHLKTYLHRLAGTVLGPEWRVISRVLEHWPDIVGETHARHALPVSVKTTRDSSGVERGRLVVRIPGALAPAFQMMEETMKARINRLMGHNFIEKIVFEHDVRTVTKTQAKKA